jgi:hypothetical protein
VTAMAVAVGDTFTVRSKPGSAPGGGNYLVSGYTAEHVSDHGIAAAGGTYFAFAQWDVVA